MKDIRQVRDSIKAAAAELFVKFGYDKTTLGDIAKRSDKAKTLVYYHFGGKLDLLKAAVEDEFNQIRTRLQEDRSDVPGQIVKRLALYLEDRMELLNSARVYRKFAVDAMICDSGEVNEAIRKIRGEFDSWEYDYFRHIAEAGRQYGAFSDAVNPESFGKMVIMLLKGLEVQFFVSDDWAQSRMTYREVLHRLLLGFISDPKELDV